MNKKLRNLLYLLSAALTVLVLVLLVFHQRILRTAGSAGAQTETVEENTQGTGVQEEEGDTQETEVWDGHGNAKDTETEAGEQENALKAETETLETELQEETTLLFTGDVMLAATMERYYDTEGVAGILSEELLTEMQNADILMINNEFQFSNRGTPMEDKQYTFRTDPEHVQVLQDMGVDIVSLANNHTIDFGTEALQDTFATLDDAGILYAGAGDTRERAEALQVIEVNGKRFGFLAATRVIPVVEWNVEVRQPGLFAAYDDTRLTERIKEARELCDFLTVYMHWGVEREAYPQDYQTAIATHCFEAGADLVIGAHPHVLQGIEFIGGKPVFYSLGNYIFNHAIAQTALVKVVVKADGTAEYSLIPAYAEGGKTELSVGEKAEALFDYMNEISAEDYVDSDGRIAEVKETAE